MPADRRRHPRAASAVPTRVDPDDDLSIPITVAEIQASDTMPPPLMEQLTRVVEIGEGLWPLRRQIERIESNVASIAKSVNRHEALLDDMLVPQLNQWRAATDELAQQIPKLISMVEGLTHHVRSIDARMRDLELEVRSLGERSAGQASDLIATQDVHKALTERIHHVEQSIRDKAIASTAIAARDKWWLALIAGAAGAIAGAAPHVYHLIAG